MWNLKNSSVVTLACFNLQRVTSLGEALCCDVQDVIDCNASIAHIQAVGIKYFYFKICGTIRADQNSAIAVDFGVKDWGQKPTFFG